MRDSAGRGLLRSAIVLACLAAATPLWASKIVLKDGRTLEGRLAKLKSLAEQPMAAPADGAPDPRLIILVEDGLRFMFVPLRRIQEANEAEIGQSLETFHIRQSVADQGGRVAMVGPIARITPFDEFGRRTVEMVTNQGMIAVIQGITMITPKWIKVEAINFEKGRDYIWEQRIAFNSVPREIMGEILSKLIDAKNIEHRLKVVRLYLQAERYKDAETELDQVIHDFPERREQFARTLLELKQAFARRALSEIELRRDAGQHRTAMRMLEAFPIEKVASETLQAVRQMQDEYRGEFERGAEIIRKFDAHVAQLDSALQDRIKPIRDEIVAELNVDNLNRLAAYRQFWDDASLMVDEKLALAISGWLAGANDATRRLPVALSLYDVRNLVRSYLNEPVKLNRNRILADFASQEGGSVPMVARLLDHMKPPLQTPASEGMPGWFELSVDTLPGEPPVTYYVQLPPEYDPLRRYPTVITLHGAGTTPSQQIDWWAGAADEENQFRLGQASRHGYIVVAPAWAAEHQKDYGYTAAEHAAVLNPLRDACRRFSIDTDRVFLSGHSMGGDAAWDIALAHPDLWAGVIPIVARGDRYIHHYWENAKNLPFYLVAGELDGDKSAHNASELDRYLTRGYNATVVEYRGRGHEHFSDEILHLFDWMGRYERDFFPREFECRSMRSWDNFFWWVELSDLPPRTIVDPDDWPGPRGTRAASTRGTITSNNGVNVRTGAARVTVWLAPEVIDFQKRVSVTVNGGDLRLPGGFIEPALGVLLEDARTRADRRHPFWAKVEMPAGRVNVME